MSQAHRSIAPRFIHRNSTAAAVASWLLVAFAASPRTGAQAQAVPLESPELVEKPAATEPARGPAPDTISSLAQILPPGIANRFAGDPIEKLSVRLNVARDTVYLLVNPGLREPRQARIDQFGSEGAAARVASLLFPHGPPGETASKFATTLATGEWSAAEQLEHVGFQFLERFFPSNVQNEPSLESVASRAVSRGKATIFLFTLDASCTLERSTLAVDLELQLFRVGVTRERVIAAELLFADAARGVAPIPEGELGTEAIAATFRSAVVDAIRDRIALSLWNHPRLQRDWKASGLDPASASP